jgi:flagellar transcriptional activator FlhD
VTEIDASLHRTKNRGRVMTQRDETIELIHELNMAWLRLARVMAQDDATRAAQSLGVTPEVVELLAKSPDSRLVELASVPQLLCAFRFESKSVLGQLAPKGVSVEVPIR